MCSLHLTHRSTHTWSSGQPTLQRPGVRCLAQGSHLSRDSNPWPRVTSLTLYSLEPRLLKRDSGPIWEQLWARKIQKLHLSEETGLTSSLGLQGLPSFGYDNSLHSCCHCLYFSTVSVVINFQIDSSCSQRLAFDETFVLYIFESIKSQQ